MLRKFVTVLTAVVAVQPMFSSLTAYAQETARREPAAEREKSSVDTEDDEYNFSWLDPDKKVYVLQNRKYRKAHHLAVFVSGGLNLSNPFKTEYVGVPRAAYWFSEQFGVEAFYGALTNSDNSTLTALRNVSSSALPYVRETRGYVGGLFTWTPWYSKLNFFNKILYYDWFFNVGLGQVMTAVDNNRRADSPPNFVTENLMAYYFGTGQDFYVTKNFLVRLDLVGMAFSAKGADNVTSHTTTNFDFTAGIGYLF